jgi:excisionase family DNA binding protein
VTAPPIASRPIWTPEQLAEVLQVSRKTVYRRIHAGDIYAKRIGRMLRIPAAVVAELLEA